MLNNSKVNKVDIKAPNLLDMLAQRIKIKNIQEGVNWTLKNLKIKTK